MSHVLNLSNTQNLKQQDDENKDSKSDAFAEELNKNWYHFIAYD